MDWSGDNLVEIILIVQAFLTITILIAVAINIMPTRKKRERADKSLKESKGDADNV